jgi:hypothetical protein
MKKFLKENCLFLLGWVLAFALLYCGKRAGYEQGYGSGYKSGYNKCMSDISNQTDSIQAADVLPNHSEIKP